MSTEEQDKILGRLIRERGEHQRKLAVLDAELRRIVSHIRSVADAVSRRCDATNHSDGAKLPSLMVSLDAEYCVNMETLNRLMAEQQQAYDDYTSAVAGISRFNP